MRRTPGEAFDRSRIRPTNQYKEDRTVAAVYDRRRYRKVVELSAFIVRRYSRGGLTRNESETLLRKWFRFLWLPLPFAKSRSGSQELVIEGGHPNVVRSKEFLDDSVYGKKRWAWRADWVGRSHRPERAELKK